MSRGIVSKRIDPNQTSEVIVTRKCAWCLSAAALVSACGAVAQADGPIKFDQPSLVDGQLVYPEGAAIPRFQTPIEVEFARTARPNNERGLVGPPRNPRATAEYEPVAGIVMSNDGTTAWNNILYHMATWITREGNADVYMCVDSAAEQTSVTTLMTNYNNAGRTIDMSRVKFHIRTTDAIWLRDYGPRFAYEGDVRIVTDHIYNYASGRPNDDAHPPGFAAIYKFPYYDNNLRHGGGNYHLDDIGRGFASRLLVNDNFSTPEATIIQRWVDWWGVSTTLFNPLPTTIDGTQHLDMWAQIVADNTVIVGDFQNSATGDNITTAGANYYQANGWNMFRTPNWSLGGVHYTHTNTVMCNNVMMVPTFTNATVSPGNAGALATFQAALPGYQVVGIPCEGIIGAAGAIHCIVMHMPLNKNGVNPGTIVYQPNGGQLFNPGDSMNITWASDDDQKPQVLTIDIDLSLDGGATFPINIATGTADDGQFSWSVPDVYSTQAKVRVRGRDPQNNTGFDLSDLDFTVNGTPPPPNCPGDANGDLVVDAADLSVVLGNFGQPALGPASGDFNGDGQCNAADLSVILAAFGTGC